jgi:hypothetical protein
VFPVNLSPVAPATAGRVVWRVADHNPGVSSGAIDFDHEADAREHAHQVAARLGVEITGLA